MKRKYIKLFRIETAGGTIVGHADTIEAAEWMAEKGRSRWVMRWVEGRYIEWRQYRR
jgi:hypothetical protein